MSAENLDDTIFNTYFVAGSIHVPPKPGIFCPKSRKSKALLTMVRLRRTGHFSYFGNQHSFILLSTPPHCVTVACQLPTASESGTSKESSRRLKKQEHIATKTTQPTHTSTEATASDHVLFHKILFVTAVV